MTDISPEIISCFFCESHLQGYENVITHLKENHLRDFNSYLMSIKNINGDDIGKNILSNVQIEEKLKIAKYEAYLKINNKKVKNLELQKVSLLEMEILNALRHDKQYKELVSDFMNKNLTEEDITFINLNKIVSCEICSKSFKSIPVLNSHMKKIHHVYQVKSRKGGIWSMDEISQLAQLELTYFQKHNKRCLSSHLNEEMDETINELNMIRYCKSYAIVLEKLFVRNNINLSIEDLLKITCEECNEIFEMYHLYESHCLEKHNNNDHPTVDLILDMIAPENYEIETDFLNGLSEFTQQSEELFDETVVSNYICKFCSEVFESNKIYRFHMKRSHRNEGVFNTTEFKCKICSEIFHNESKYIRHMEKCQNNVTMEIYNCEYCSVQFHKRKSLHRHLEKDHSEKLNKDAKVLLNCEFCAERFTTKEQYNLHQIQNHKLYVRDSSDKVTMEIYNCEFCSVQFHKRKSLRRHLEKDHSEKLNKFKKDAEVVFNCEICAERFATKEQYDVHQIQNHKSGKRRARDNSDSLPSKRAKH